MDSPRGEGRVQRPSVDYAPTGCVSEPVRWNTDGLSEPGELVRSKRLNVTLKANQMCLFFKNSQLKCRYFDHRANQKLPFVTSFFSTRLLVQGLKTKKRPCYVPNGYGNCHVARMAFGRAACAGTGGAANDVSAKQRKMVCNNTSSLRQR